jgi:hypothetical protein
MLSLIVPLRQITPTTKRRKDLILTPLLIPSNSTVDSENAVVNRPHLGRFTDCRDITRPRRKVLLSSSLLLVYRAIIQTFNLLFNAPEWSLNPIEDTNQTTMQQYQQDVVYQTLSANDTLKKHYDYYDKSTTRTQSPILTINQLVRPRSIVNKKKEAVIAVTQTKIMLLFVLLLICLLIR